MATCTSRARAFNCSYNSGFSDCLVSAPHILGHTLQGRALSATSYQAGLIGELSAGLVLLHHCTRIGHHSTKEQASIWIVHHSTKEQASIWIGHHSTKEQASIWIGHHSTREQASIWIGHHSIRDQASIWIVHHSTKEQASIWIGHHSTRERASIWIGHHSTKEQASIWIGLQIGAARRQGTTSCATLARRLSDGTTE